MREPPVHLAALVADGADPSRATEALAVRAIAAACADHDVRLTAPGIAEATGLTVTEVSVVLSSPKFHELWREAITERAGLLLGKAFGRLETIIVNPESRDADAVAAARVVASTFTGLAEAERNHDAAHSRAQLRNLMDTLRKARSRLSVEKAS